MRRFAGWVVVLSLWWAGAALAEERPHPAAGAPAAKAAAPDLRGFAPPMPDPRGEWSPVRVGEEALYRIVSKREMSQGPHLKVSEGLSGTQHFVVSQAPGDHE